MKQLYKIGILVAILLLVLLGLSKLSNRPDPSVSDGSLNDTEITREVATETSSTTTKEDTTNQTQPMSETSNATNTVVVLKTSKGDVTLELFTKDMPITAGNFLKLANENFYDGVKFHRVIDGFMVQGGDPNSKDDTKKAQWGRGNPGYAIADEFVPGYSNVRGTISMANSGPNTGGSQFFINLVDNVNLDYDKPPLTSQHPVFGRVIGGMEIIDAIGHVDTDQNDVPLEPVVIEDITVSTTI